MCVFVRVCDCDAGNLDVYCNVLSSFKLCIVPSRRVEVYHTAIQYLDGQFNKFQLSVSKCQ